MFEKYFPSLYWWINNQGWIELGDRDEDRNCWVTIYDSDVQEISYEDNFSKSLDVALKKAEKWTAKKIKEEFE